MDHVNETNLQLVAAKATKVLGEYNHEVEFPDEQNFLIVYGPNGVGKTKFLEIIHALSQLDGRALQQLPFDTASLRYADGSVLKVTGIDAPVVQVSGRWIARRLEFTYRRPGLKTSRWEFTQNEFEEWLEDNTPWRKVDDTGDLWEDRTDGELTNLSDLERRYSDRGRRPGRAAPELFKRLREQSRSYLIETQRLRIENASPRPRGIASRPSRNRPESKIAQHAAKMQTLLNNAQTEHSTITQQRDRDFPNRVLAGATALPDADAVRERYEEQNTFRSRLGRVASVDLADALSLPDRELEDWELRLLNLYLDDAEAKLAPFEKLLQKIELLEEIINSRLLRKQLEVTARDGLSVRHVPEGRPLDLNSLSSGEQHEIILMFDLLFNVPQGALVLIDEPEISLHVVWQIAFIPDVQRIAELAGFRFIVATHSPQIINDAWDSAFALGPEEVPFV